MARPRSEIDAELAELAGHIAAWRQHLRHEAQFWPQLRALVEPILDGAHDVDAAHACGRVLEMLAVEGIVDLEEGREVVAWLRRRARGDGPGSIDSLFVGAHLGAMPFCQVIKSVAPRCAPTEGKQSTLAVMRDRGSDPPRARRS